MTEAGLKGKNGKVETPTKAVEEEDAEPVPPTSPVDSQDEDPPEGFISKEALEEEHKLHEQREKEFAAEAARAKEEDKHLSEKRFDQLNKLLDQTNMYSRFLTEQMSNLDQFKEGEGEKAEEEAGGKRKGGKLSKKGSKKGKGSSGDLNGLSPTKELLPLIEGEMRNYQLKGVKWMISLYQNGLNGILADQMGLGKTVQTIGFLSHLRSKNVMGPFLVVGPLSTLPNWVSEFERWCPTMPAVLYHGSRQERAEIRSRRMPTGRVDDKFPVIITSYEIVMADSKFLQKYQFKYIVVDEGHRLKNFDCKLIRELRMIPTANKLLLSGTPLQNNLQELWSLLNFLLPDVFNNLADFRGWFDFSEITSREEAEKAEMTREVAEREQKDRIVSKLHDILKPFLLRRLKSDVEYSLPRKKEIVIYSQMVKVQRDFNQQLVDKTLQEHMKKMAESLGGGKVSTSLNNVLMQLRKNCNHPDLISGGFDGSLYLPSPEEMVRDCGKMALLDRMLPKLKARGHKVLIFSQMTKMLDLLESYLEQKGHAPCRIDGSVSWQDRQAQMKAFNEDPEGINLVAADTVIIYDSDWNPHQDMQAMDRCHRIGQTRPVHVYRLATAHSVEGKMLRRAASKLMLERLVIKQGAFLQNKEEAKVGSMKAEELLDILKTDYSQEDVAQSKDLSDKDLERVMDRSDMVDGFKGATLPSCGPGWEVVEERASSLLTTVE